MSSGDASTLPLRETPLDGELPKPGRRLVRLRAAGALDARPGALAGSLALASIVLLSLLAVVIAADRPSTLTPTAHVDFFPGWMAGPLGGLWPGLTSDTTTLRWLFTAIIVAMYVGYVVVLVRSPALALRWIVGAILAVHLIYLLAPPLALTDVFNYINYGRMEIVHHLNPYTSTPISEPHDDPAFILSNWHQLLSPYGPLFTLITFAVVPLGVAASFWVLKGIISIASLATILLVYRCARLLGRDPRPAIALVGLNPIVLVWGLGGDHNDFLMVLFITLGFYLLLCARAARRLPPMGGSGATAAEQGALSEAGAAAAPTPPADDAQVRTARFGVALSPAVLEVLAGASFVVAVAVKASAAVLIPVVLMPLLRSPRSLARFLLGLLLAGIAIGLCSLIAFGVHLPDLSTQSKVVTLESVPNLLGLIVGAGGETDAIHKLMSLALLSAIALCCWQAYKRREAITPSGWATIALLLTLGWVLPWYVVWVLPLAALSRSRRLRVAALAVGVYLIISWAPASGLVWGGIGFHPERTPLGRLHQRTVRELLN
jgi:hypothetical protein